LFSGKYILSIIVVLLGAMDCLTTVIGQVYCGTSELNPLIAELVSTNLPLFVIIKLSVSVGVGVMLVWAEKSLQKSKDTDVKSYKVAKKTLTAAYACIIIFLCIVVLNNALVILGSLSA
jgi:hypothetical protein